MENFASPAFVCEPAPREKLADMNELEREMILADRASARDDARERHALLQSQRKTARPPTRKVPLLSRSPAEFDLQTPIAILERFKWTMTNARYDEMKCQQEQSWIFGIAVGPGGYQWSAECGPCRGCWARVRVVIWLVDHSKETPSSSRAKPRPACRSNTRCFWVFMG